MRIIPAIDVIGGKCVRLRQGDYASQTVYRENPADVAKEFEDAGLKYLHLVDLDGAKSGRVVNWNVVTQIATQTKLQIDFGGGVKTEHDIKRLFELGVKQVNLGSIAVKDRAQVKTWITQFGSDCIILSADVKDRVVKISGWTEATSLTLDDLVSDYEKHGLNYVACTDINTDGMLAGPNIDLYTEMQKLFPTIRWIASGGVSSMEDLRALKNLGLDGAIIGKAIFEGKLKLKELSML